VATAAVSSAVCFGVFLFFFIFKAFAVVGFLPDLHFTSF